MPDVSRDNNVIPFTQLRFSASRECVSYPALNHNQGFPAVGVIVAAIRVAWLQNAAAHGQIVAVAQGPISKPGEITPAEFLTLRFAVREDLDVVGHGNGIPLNRS